MKAQQGHGAPDGGEREPEFTPRATRYALGLLLVVYVFNFVDRSLGVRHLRADLEANREA